MGHEVFGTGLSWAVIHLGRGSRSTAKLMLVLRCLLGEKRKPRNLSIPSLKCSVRGKYRLAITSTQHLWTQPVLTHWHLKYTQGSSLYSYGQKQLEMVSDLPALTLLNCFMSRSYSLTMEHRWGLALLFASCLIKVQQQLTGAPWGRRTCCHTCSPPVVCIIGCWDNRAVGRVSQISQRYREVWWWWWRCTWHWGRWFSQSVQVPCTSSH